MVFIKVKNGCILLDKPKYNGKNNNFKIGLESIFLKGLNLINIETDCKIKIDERVIHIKKDEYTISNLNKLIKPVTISYDDKKIQIKSPCYYYLDENLKKYLGFPNTSFDFSLVGNKSTIYFPTSDEKYINIEEDCEFRVYTDDKDDDHFIVYKIPIGIYLLDELDLILNGDKNEHFIDLEINNENKLKITSVYNCDIDKNLKKYLGCSLMDVTHYYPYIKTGTEKINFYTQGFLKDINGVIFYRSNEIEIEPDKINNIKIKGNYSIDQLIRILPSNIKLQNDNNFITLTSKNDFLLDKNLKISLGIDNDYLYKHAGDSDIINNNINKQLLEVHCNIVEKSVSSINEKVIQEELLFVYYYEPNNPFIKSNPIMYRQVIVNNIQMIKIHFNDQNGNIVHFDEDFIVYLDLIEDKTK